MATVPEYTGFVPARNQAQDVFNTNMAQYFSYIANLAPAINTTAQEINDTAVTVAQTTAEEAAARTATEVEAALSQYVTDASGFADGAASSATFADNMADAVAQATATYTTVAAGLSGTVSGDYFRVIEAPEAERVSVYRNDAGSATLITTYYTKTGVDAKQAAAVRLNRSLQRLGDNGQTLHSDFNLAAYGLGSQLVGGVQDAMEAEELWDVQRATPKYVLQHTGDGSLKYVEVPVDTLAREWNPETGEYAALIEGSATNELTWNSDLSNASWYSGGSQWERDFDSLDFPLNFEGNPAKVLKATRLTGGDSLLVRKSGLSLTAGQDVAVSMMVYFPSGQTLTNPALTIDFNDNDRTLSEQLPTDKWVRIPILPTLSADRTALDIGLSTTAGNDNVPIGTVVYIAVPQLETGTHPTSPIITTDAPKTRAPDRLKSRIAEEINLNSFTLFTSMRDIFKSTSLPSVVGFQAESGLNRLVVFLSGNGEDFQVLMAIDGVQVIDSGGTVPVNENAKIAVRIFNTELSLFIDGNKAYESQFSADLSTLTELFIGGRRGAAVINSGYETVGIYPALNDTQLQELTQ